MMGFTHFAPNTNGNGFVLFEQDVCENCDKVVQLPNAMSTPEPKAKLLRLGLKFIAVAPPEIYAMDDGGYACDDCESAYVCQ